MWAHWWLKHHPGHPGGRARSCVGGGTLGGPNANALLVGEAVAMLPYLLGLSLPSSDANKLPGGAETSLLIHEMEDFKMALTSTHVPFVERRPSSGCHQQLCPRVSSIATCLSRSSQR